MTGPHMPDERGRRAAHDDLQQSHLPVRAERCGRCGGCPDVTAKNPHATHRCGGFRGVDNCVEGCGKDTPCTCTESSQQARTTEITAWRGDDGYIVLSKHLPLVEDVLPEQGYRVATLDVTDADNPAFAADLALAIEALQDRCAALQQLVWTYEDNHDDD